MSNLSVNLLRRWLACCVLLATVTGGVGAAILTDISGNVSTSARYLFFLHGKIVEDEGARPISPQHGAYEYQQMLDAFESRGFTVISEARAKDTDPRRYASKVVSQIKTLLDAKVPPGRITVVGASKGAVIAMLVSAQLRNRDVNYVLMGNCNDAILRMFDVDLWGNVLSIYAPDDEFGQTCRRFFDKATGLNRSDEIELKLLTGHGFLFQPLPEWVEPTVGWASR